MAKNNGLEQPSVYCNYPNHIIYALGDNLLLCEQVCKQEAIKIMLLGVLKAKEPSCMFRKGFISANRVGKRKTFFVIFSELPESFLSRSCLHVVWVGNYKAQLNCVNQVCMVDSEISPATLNVHQLYSTRAKLNRVQQRPCMQENETKELQVGHTPNKRNKPVTHTRISLMQFSQSDLGSPKVKMARPCHIRQPSFQYACTKSIYSCSMTKALAYNFSYSPL